GLFASAERYGNPFLIGFGGPDCRRDTRMRLPAGCGLKADDHTKRYRPRTADKRSNRSSCRIEYRPAWKYLQPERRLTASAATGLDHHAGVVRCMRRLLQTGSTGREGTRRTDKTRLTGTDDAG